MQRERGKFSSRQPMPEKLCSYRNVVYRFVPGRLNRIVPFKSVSRETEPLRITNIASVNFSLSILIVKKKRKKKKKKTRDPRKCHARI